MRALRVLGLVVVVMVTGLLSGGAAGAPAVAARSAPAAAPAVGAPAAPVPAVPARPAPIAIASAATAAAAVDQAEAASTIVAGTPCRATARACVELSSNRSWLISDGVVQYGPVPIRHGGEGYRTPPGTFTVNFKNRHHVSSIYDTPMPYAVFFNGDIAFHQGSLGGPSHGCVRLSQDAASTYFAELQPGDIVQVVS